MGDGVQGGCKSKKKFNFQKEMKSSLNCFYAVGRHGRQYLVSGVVALSSP